MAEYSPNSLVPFDAVFANRQGIVERAQEPLTPVGIVTFDKGRKMFLLGEREDGSLQGQIAPSPEGFNPDNIIEGKGRMRELKQCEVLSVGQIDLEERASLEMRVSGSIRGRPNIGVRFNYRDLVESDESGQRQQFFASEDELLQTFTAQKAGIMVFEGGYLPEETALVFIREAKGDGQGEKRASAHVFFFHSAETHWGLDSPTGLRLFLGRLNEQFAREAPLPLQDEVLKAFDQAIKDGTLSFQSPVQQELLKTRLIAHARMATNNPGDREHSQFIEKHLPNLKKGLQARALRLLGKKHQVPQEDIDQAVGELIIGGETERKKPEAKQLEAKEKTIYDQLKTERARSLRHSAEEALGEENPLTRTYFSKLVDMVMDSSMMIELEDAETLIRELRKSPFGASFVIEHMNLNRPTGERVLYMYGRTGNNVALMIDYVLAMILLKKDELMKAQSLPELQPQREPAILERLKTDSAKELRRGYDPQYGEDIEATKSYLDSIYQTASSQTATLEELNDADALLSELLGAERFVNDEFYLSVTSRYYPSSPGAPSEATGGQLISRIKSVIRENRDRRFDQRGPTIRIRRHDS